jgi:membrane-bound serine protease (ClpP class)
MNIKNLVRPTLIAAFLAGLLLTTVGAQEQGPIYRITLDDEIINPVAAEYIISAIDRAEKEKAACLIIELDTPGGLLSSTRTIVKRIMNANVPIVVYVAPKGARAGSAGVFITLAANIAAMAPSTNIGAAHPVQLADRRSTGEALEELIEKLSQKEEEKKAKKEPKKEAKPKYQPMEQKVLSDTKAWVEAIARDRGRNVSWALKAVEESVSATETQAKKQRVIDFIAKDIDDLVAKLDGRRVELPAGKTIIKTTGITVVEIPKNFRLRWLAVLAHPNIAYILLMLGFYGLLFEFTHPGIGFPGIGGAICLILAFFGLQVLPTNYAGIALIALAIAMFIAEIKVTSYGLLTLGGIVTLFLGSLILFASPYEFMRASLPVIISFTAATLAVALFLAYMALRSQRRRPVTGAEGLVRATGEVISWEDRGGKVFVHGELWEAEADEELAPGNAIEVISVVGMVLIVKKKGKEG